MAARQARGRRLGTLRDLRTAVSARVRSKPVAEGQRYLDLYTLKRERARWSGAKQRAEQRIQTIDAAIEKLGFSQELIEECESQEPGPEKTIRFRSSPRTKRSA